MWKDEVWEGLHVWRDEEGDSLEARRRTVVDGSQLFFGERESLATIRDYCDVVSHLNSESLQSTVSNR